MDHFIRSQRVDETTQSSSSGRYAHSQRPALCEVLRHYGGRANKTDAHSDAVADALTEDELPDGFGEGCCNVSASRQG